jgi:hypothetical protein
VGRPSTRSPTTTPHASPARAELRRVRGLRRPVRRRLGRAVPGLRGRPAAAARVVVAAAGGPVDVRAAAGGWTVRRPTGASSVVGALTALVAAVGPAGRRRGRPAGRPRVPARPGRTVAGRGPRARPAAGSGSTPAPPAGPSGSWPAVAGVVAAPDDPRRCSPHSWPIRCGGTSGSPGLRSATLPGWGGVTGPLPGVPAAVLPAQVPALVALLAVRLSGRPHGGAHADAGGRRRGRAGRGRAGARRARADGAGPGRR